MNLFLIALFLILCQIIIWLVQRKRHLARVDKIPLRIHVNGIRGKSTVTRLVAGVLRAGGYQVVAKTTGSAARIIHRDGSESPIRRLGAPTILEQVNVIAEHVGDEPTDAIVFECMAVNPDYQAIAQDEIVQGHITIITNVREDHQDQMGQTLPEIADALATTIPTNGMLITAEHERPLRVQLTRIARERGSKAYYANGANVIDAEMRGFDYLAFKDNVAIGLTVARLLNIPRHVALQGMQRARPDVGAVNIRTVGLSNKLLVWAPLFAVNDRESVIANVEALKRFHHPRATRIGILNNRTDRGDRALRFADIAVNDLALDYYITFGAYESQVTQRMVALGFPRERIINLGFSKNPSLEQILRQVGDLISGRFGLLVGLVNIHTPQAERLLDYFDDDAALHPAVERHGYQLLSPAM